MIPNIDMECWYKLFNNTESFSDYIRRIQRTNKKTKWKRNRRKSK